MIVTDRRELLASLGALVGLASLPAEALALTPDAPFLGAPRMALVTAFADTLIPRTDTPGAVDAKVPATFDALMRVAIGPEHRDAYLHELKGVDTFARERTGKLFAALPPATRTALLTEYDAREFARFTDPLDPDAAYLRLKEMIVSLYYLSEPGATIELRYEHVPGVWAASIPMTPATRAWGGANVG